MQPHFLSPVHQANVGRGHVVQNASQRRSAASARRKKDGQGGAPEGVENARLPGPRLFPRFRLAPIAKRLPTRAQKKRAARRKHSPHGLDGVGEDDFLVRVALVLVVAAVVDELHLFQDCRLWALR